MLPLALLNTVCQFRHLVEDRASLGHQFTDFAVSVDHGGVVAPPKFRTDLRQGHLGQFTQQVHGDLPRGDQRAGTRLAVQFFNAQPEVLSGLLYRGKLY